MSPIDITKGVAHFRKTDPIMYALVQSGLQANDPIALPTPKPKTDYFASIVTSIISQQISVKAAAAVQGRVVHFLGGSITPERVLKVDPDALKACGLSGQKTKYIIHNAKVWHEIPYGNFVQMTDDEVITELIKLYGIGRWTAEMFLMFSLARPDVFSYGDLGLMQGLYESYNYKPHYVRKIRTTVESWSPHRTLASLALWYSKDNEPVLL